MLCTRCEQTIDHGVARSRWGAPEGLRRVLCRNCGAVLPAHALGDRLLDKLSQLARFGLVADATLLIPPRGEG